MVTDQVEAHLIGSDVLVWSNEGVDLLRTKWRIVGNFVGALPQKPMQNLQLTLPLLLLPEEVALLLHKESMYATLRMHFSIADLDASQGVLKVHHETSPEVFTEATASPWTRIAGLSEHQTLRDSVFRDLWEKGYYLTSGMKYGGDFLVYPDLPSKTHASHIAIVLPWKQPSNTLVSLARVAATVKKNILLCSAADDEQISYHTMEWAGIT